ncbi:MAG TPA: AraC family transcriptional regulator [Thermoanaerobaculia bacterium]|nr:AraC family transcriptional regulator [Thermoanaerobaculia bacterium]
MTEALYAAGSDISPHVHDRNTLAFAISGRFVERVGSETIHCEENTVLFIRAHEVHNEFFPEPTRLIIVETPALDLLRELRNSFERFRHLRDRRYRPLLLRIWNEIHRRDALAPVVVEAKLLELCAEVARAGNETAPRDRWQVCTQILLDTVGQEVDVEALAAATGFTVRSFLRRFRLHFGCSVQAYVRRLRIDIARARLLEEDVDLRTLALELGFYDQPHFSNAFKKAVGVTPSEYRLNPR